MPFRSNVLDAVRLGYQAGLCLLPVRDDGTKAPDVASWTTCQTRRPTVEAMRAFNFGQRAGYGLVGGDVSGRIDPWDFDDPETFDAFVTAAHACGLGAVIDRIRAGYEDETPKGGRRWLVHYPDGVTFTDTVLARRPGRDGEPKVKTLIELTLFSILAPSNGATHPTGRAYVRLSGDFTTIADYTTDERQALFELARSFDCMPRRVAQTPTSKAADDLRPGDDFNARMTWPALLDPAGWTRVYDRGEATYWRRPGKGHGVSATTNYAGSDLFYPFTSSSEFQPDTSFSKFAVYTLLQHGGDYRRAALALSQEGYGTRSTVEVTSIEPPLSAASTPDTSLTLTPIGDLLAEPDEAVDWLVDDRIPAGGVALMAAKPKVGKSTAARGLALAVARGETWLGHACAAGMVWYLAFEGRRRDIRAHFRQMGAQPTDALRVFVGQAPKNVVAVVRKLAGQEHPALIIIDTMQRFLKAQSTDDYAEMTTLFDAVIGIAQQSGATMLLLHHSGKADRASLDAVLGSTAITGSADTILLLAKTERYRTIATVQRVGDDLEDTVILLDPLSGRVALGPRRQQADEAIVGEAILTALQNADGPQTEAQLEELVDARTALKRRALRYLVSREQVTRLGRGGKGDPYRYAVSCSRSHVPHYMGEQQNINPNLSVTPTESALQSQDSCSHVRVQGSCSQDHCCEGGALQLRCKLCRQSPTYWAEETPCTTN